MNPQYDNVLISIIQNEGGPDKYLDIMFGFLMRRTDFFFEKQDGKGPGLPPGIARKIVLGTFDKYQRFFKKYQEESLKSTSTPGSNTQADHKNDTSNDGVSNAASEPSATAPAVTKPVTSEHVSKPKPTKKEVVGPGSSFKKDDKGERIYVADPECYNGARRNQYSWSQQILDIDIRVKIPEGIKSVRDLTVRIGKKHVFISENGAEVPIIDLDLFREVKTETATWSFEPDENVVLISLDKTDDYWWEAAFFGEEKINVQNIDASRPMEDLDEETQAKIAQMMFDQEQKRKGLPTTEEKRIQDILAGAWNKEGSPFQGQPFDPSQIAMGSAGGDRFPDPPEN